MTGPTRLKLRLFAVGLLVVATRPAVAAPLDFEGFFSGRLTGTGSVDNRRDGTHRLFSATIAASWHGAQGTVTEDLSYADGETKRFAWTFDRIAAGHWTGHRDDLVGDADVRLEGDTLRMTYTARTRLPSGSTWTLSFDDRFAQNDAATVTMAGTISYLFVGVGMTQMRIVKAER